jgi:hypothetical protein
VLSGNEQPKQRPAVEQQHRSFCFQKLSHARRQFARTILGSVAFIPQATQLSPASSAVPVMRGLKLPLRPTGPAINGGAGRDAACATPDRLLQLPCPD